MPHEDPHRQHAHGLRDDIDGGHSKDLRAIAGSRNICGRRATGEHSYLLVRRHVLTIRILGVLTQVHEQDVLRREQQMIQHVQAAVS